MYRIFTMLLLLVIILNNVMLSQETIEKGGFSGLVFGDYYYNISRDSGLSKLSDVGVSGTQGQNGFQFRRVYLTYDYTISTSFSTRIRFDVEPNSLTSDGKIGSYIRDAYLKWSNIFDGSDLYFGIQQTPTFDVSEQFWENRHIEMTIIDYRKAMTSKDFGIALKGNILNNGMLKYWLMFGNGSGNRPELDRYKTLYIHLQLSPTNNLTSTIYYHHKFLPPKTVNINQITSLNNDEDLFALFLGYQLKDIFKLGIEPYLSFRQNEFNNQGEFLTKTSLGSTFFGILYISKNIDIVCRYDYFDPNIDGKVVNDKRHLYIIALNLKPDPKVTIAPNIIVETYERLPQRTIKPSITTKLTFFYVF